MILPEFPRKTKHGHSRNKMSFNGPSTDSAPEPGQGHRKWKEGFGQQAHMPGAGVSGGHPQPRTQKSGLSNSRRQY